MILLLEDWNIYDHKTHPGLYRDVTALCVGRGCARQLIVLPRQPRGKIRRAIGHRHIRPRRLWIPYTRSPIPSESDIGHAMWSPSQPAMERTEKPSAVGFFLGI